MKIIPKFKKLCKKCGKRMSLSDWMFHRHGATKKPNIWIGDGGRKDNTGDKKN